MTGPATDIAATGWRPPTTTSSSGRPWTPATTTGWGWTGERCERWQVDTVAAAQ